jgi:hypothetical protein
MGIDRIVCLANSYKHDHRCVAGISLVTRQWVRLVGRQIPGCLTVKEASYSDGKQAAPLDVFEAEFNEKCGSNSHPEDVFVTGRPWRLLPRGDEARYLEQISEHISRRSSILQGYSDCVSADRVMETPRERSLELIEPEDLWWWIREDRSKRKNRAIFRVSRATRVRYDLAVTDPVWLDQLHLLPAGIYPHSFLFKDRPPRTLLTVSLSELFEGYHYKLVAAVVCLPAWLHPGKSRATPEENLNLRIGVE